MFKTVLIPLDGSKLAEAALSRAKSIAQHGNPPGELVLIRVVPDLDMRGMPPNMVEEFQMHLKHDCQKYLDGVVQ